MIMVNKDYQSKEIVTVSTIWAPTNFTSNDLLYATTIGVSDHTELKAFSHQCRALRTRAEMVGWESIPSRHPKVSQVGPELLDEMIG